LVQCLERVVHTGSQHEQSHREQHDNQTPVEAGTTKRLDLFLFQKRDANIKEMCS
jgi:hypothetical protein